jgi:hypothetical protein
VVKVFATAAAAAVVIMKRTMTSHTRVKAAVVVVVVAACKVCFLNQVYLILVVEVEECNQLAYSSLD